MKQLEAKITENKRIAPGFYRMQIESPYLAKASKPGQFVEVRCSGGYDPLLRRPLGVHRILKNGIEMLYEVVGRGTEMLSKKKSGELLDVIGPLGNGFDIKPTALLIAGGVGVAPLVALAEELEKRAQEHKSTRAQVIIGAKTKSHILCEKDFKELGADIYIATEDGSRGHKGFATDILKKLLQAPSSKPQALYACGPNPMLKAVAAIAKARRIPCQASLEGYMACGIGVCLGCPVRVKGGYKMVCKDGPIFNTEEIIW